MVCYKIKDDDIILCVAGGKDPSKLLQINDGRAGTAEHDLDIRSGKMDAFVQDIYYIEETVLVCIFELFIGLGVFSS